MSTVLSVENVSKIYRLGDIGGATLKEEFARWWAKRRGDPDPLSKITGEDHTRRIGDMFLALDNVSFEVKQGEVLGIIGRNGAGKSTLLKILSQVTAPSSGRIRIKGRIASLLEVGTGFHPELTGRENIFLNGAILGMTKAEIRQKFDSIVAFSEIEQFIDTPVKRYSSGMYVRLAFAVAAHLEPEILILDEVLAVGDVQFQKKCLGKMKEVGSQGRTILFVSHNVNAVSSLCRSAMVLVNGQMVHYSDDVSDALRLYLSPPVSSHTVDLCNHPGRTSGKEGVFEEISIADESNGPTQCLLPGANVAIRLKVRPHGKLTAPRVSIGFTDSRGERVFAIGTFIGGNEIPSVEDFATVCVRFVIPPLVPGQYTLDIGFYDRTGSPLDEIYGAAAIEMLKDSYISMVEGHSHYFGNIMVRSEWSLTPNRDGDSGDLASADGHDRILSGSDL